MPADPTLDEKIAAVRPPGFYWIRWPRGGEANWEPAEFRTDNAYYEPYWKVHGMAGLLMETAFAEIGPRIESPIADLEASRSTPGSDDPKDAERLAGIDAQINHARFHEGTSDVAFLRRLLTTATRRAEEMAIERIIILDELGQSKLECGEVRRRAEALEAENAHLRTQAGLPPIKTRHEQALRDTINGQGLSMVAMGKELREKDEKIKSLEAEVGRLSDLSSRQASQTERFRQQISRLAQSLADTFGTRGPDNVVPPAADLEASRPAPYSSDAERLDLIRVALKHPVDKEDAEAAELVAFLVNQIDKRGVGAGAEKMRERAAASAASYETQHETNVGIARNISRNIEDAIRALPLPREE